MDDRRRCPACGTVFPQVRMPTSLHQAWRGGNTCSCCLTEVDVRGVVVQRSERTMDGQVFEVLREQPVVRALLVGLVPLGFGVLLAARIAGFGAWLWSSVALLALFFLPLLASMAAFTLWYRWVPAHLTVMVATQRAVVDGRSVPFAHVDRVERDASRVRVRMDDGRVHIIPSASPDLERALLDALEAFRAAQASAAPMDAEVRAVRAVITER